MICISINQESRRLALVDMHNAAPQGDLLEIRLDRFDKAPDMHDLIGNKPKPVIMSCRRPQDGGAWQGTETERLALLRQCIISKADYVEIELDVADDIRRFPPSQRVISYTNLQETPADILDIYEEAKTKSPDVIKLVTLARTPEEAWPLVQIVAKATVPTVVVGLGKPGIMLALLSKKLGAPWVYAALEKGMEAYPGQATVHDLRAIYHFERLDKSTRLLGVTGFGARESATVAVVNAAMAHLDMPFRCLPMGVGNMKLFRKVMDAVKLGAALIDPEHQQSILEIGPQLHGPAKQIQAADVLIHKGDAWHAFHAAAPAWTSALAETLKAKNGADNPFKSRIVVIVGLNAAARILAQEILRCGGSAILASHFKKAGGQLAQALGCRYIQTEALYTTMHDVLILCDEEQDEAGRTLSVHAGYLKSGMTVMDLTGSLARTALLQDALDRGCHIVEPRRLFIHQLEEQIRLLAGKPVPREVIEKALPEEDYEINDGEP